jgi:acyl-CoA synthetase (AMP-forming)/AMP-acid ligase II
MSYCASVFSGKHSTLVDILRYRAEQQPNQLAYCFLQDGEELHVTYQALDAQARSVAAQLQALNMQNERVLLWCLPGLEYIAAFLGCLYAGAIAVPVYPPRPNQSSKRLQTISINAQPKCILTTSSLITKLTRFVQNDLALESVHYLIIDALDKAEYWQPIDIQPDTIAFLQYTSGSTATPKGVMVSHANLMHNSAIIQQQFATTSNSRGMIWLPPYHDMGLIGGILQPLYTGFLTILMSPVMFLQRPLRWLKAISQYQATVSGGPNFAYDLCAQKISPEQCDGLDLSSWEVAFTGAEPIQATTLERFAMKFAPYGFKWDAFYPCYGLAEATLMVSGNAKSVPPTVLPVEKQALVQNQVATRVQTHSLDVGQQSLVGCGQVVSGQVAIVNPETRTCCSANQIGEIWLKGSSVTQGYWQQPELSQQTFQAVLTDTGEGSFLRTGDLGFLQNGELFVTGRLKDVIIIRGQNHHPTDIEITTVTSHSALRNGGAAAFTIAQEAEVKLVIAVEVEREWLRKVNAEEVTHCVRQRIAHQHDLRVHTVILLKPGSIPKTSSGKIQRFACRQAFLNGTLSTINDLTNELGNEKTLSRIAIAPSV